MIEWSWEAHGVWSWEAHGVVFAGSAEETSGRWCVSWSLSVRRDGESGGRRTKMKIPALRTVCSDWTVSDSLWEALSAAGELLRARLPEIMVDGIVAKWSAHEKLELQMWLIDQSEALVLFAFDGVDPEPPQ